MLILAREGQSRVLVEPDVWLIDDRHLDGGSGCSVAPPTSQPAPASPTDRRYAVHRCGGGGHRVPGPGRGGADADYRLRRPHPRQLSAVESATMAQLSLCARFQSAIEAFRGERWEEAESRFQDILRDYPDDGPARFYLDQRLPAVRRAAAPVSSSPAV